jgi:predicted kinase
MKYPIIDDQEIDKTEYDIQCNGNILICTVGLPRSGKSTWARQAGFPIIDPDGIRLAMTGRRWYGPIEHEIWATARTMVRALFWSGNKVVVLDSPNYQKRARDVFIPSPDCHWKRHFILINTPANVCKERAEETYPVLCDIIDWFVENWEPIDEKTEGKITTVITQED